MNGQKYRPLWFYLIAFVLFQVAFGIAFVRLKQMTGTSQILDVYFHYTPQQAFDLLHRYGEVARKWIIALMAIDFIYPVIYALLLYHVFRYFGAAKILTYLPWLIAGFDYLENVLELRMLLGFPKAVLSTAKIAAWVTSFKWSLVILTLFLLFMVAIRKFILALKNKKRR